MKELADDLNRKVAHVNNSPPFRADAKTDTIAVGLSRGEIIVAGNVKARRETHSTANTQYTRLQTPKSGRRGQKARYDDYGISKDLSKLILSEVSNSPVYYNSQLDVNVIEEKHNPRDNPKLPMMIDKARDHAAKHAETKIQAYCEKKRKSLKKVAVSKEPCEGCYADLRKHGVAMIPEEPGTKRVTSRRAVDKGEVEVRNRIDRSKEYETDFHMYNNNFHQSPKAAKEIIKSNVKRSVKPGASVGILSGKCILMVYL